MFEHLVLDFGFIFHKGFHFTLGCGALGMLAVPWEPGMCCLKMKVHENTFNLFNMRLVIIRYLSGLLFGCYPKSSETIHEFCVYPSILLIT